MSFDFVVGSEDTITLTFKDDDGAGTLTPIDLTLATNIKMVCKFNSANAVEFSLTKDPDQVANTGKATYIWGPTDLTAGLLQVQGKFSDIAGNARLSYEILEFKVLAALA